jgi:hypothetical protein
MPKFLRYFQVRCHESQQLEWEVDGLTKYNLTDAKSVIDQLEREAAMGIKKKNFQIVTKLLRNYLTLVFVFQSLISVHDR